MRIVESVHAGPFGATIRAYVRGFRVGDAEWCIEQDAVWVSNDASNLGTLEVARCAREFADKLDKAYAAIKAMSLPKSE